VRGEGIYQGDEKSRQDLTLPKPKGPLKGREKAHQMVPQEGQQEGKLMEQPME
jgi:hypothetical protein